MTPHRLSICLSFDFDAMSGWIAAGADAASISRGEYSAVAVPRVLALLAKYNARATFFVPGHTALAYPNLIREIVDAGHEVAHHGWVHENPATLEPDQERETFERGFAAVETAGNVPPVGYRSPGAAFSSSTIEILLAHKMLYDSSCSGSDFTPYYLRLGDSWSKMEPYSFGEPCSLVELPFSWILDDVPHFEFEPGFSHALSPPSDVREIWQGELEYAYATVTTVSLSSRCILRSLDAGIASRCSMVWCST